MRSRRSHARSVVALSFVLATKTTIEVFMCRNSTPNVAQVDAYIMMKKSHPHHRRRRYSSWVSLNLLAADLAAEEREFHQERSNEKDGNKNVVWHKSASLPRRQEDSLLVEAAAAATEVERRIPRRKITKAGVAIALPSPSLDQRTIPSTTTAASRRRRQCPPPTFTPTVTADTLEYWFHTLQGMEEEGIIPPPRPKLLQSIRSKWKRLFPKEEVVQRYFVQDDDIFDHVDLNLPSHHQNMRPL